MGGSAGAEPCYPILGVGVPRTPLLYVCPRLPHEIAALGAPGTITTDFLVARPRPGNHRGVAAGLQRGATTWLARGPEPRRVYQNASGTTAPAGRDNELILVLKRLPSGPTSPCHSASVPAQPNHNGDFDRGESRASMLVAPSRGSSSIAHTFTT